MLQKEGFLVSTDKSMLDFDMIYNFISGESYWGKGRSREVMKRAIDNSVFCFGVYKENRQIGFARIISDLATFAYLADVFILEGYRGHGLGRWLIDSIINHPELAAIKRIALFTRTPNFYQNAGFEQFDPENDYVFMQRGRRQHIR